ncbi:MAG: hypothetical protein J4G17_01540 [Anaerolineae bacterium]|nr:hypothetical protein [Anaerolineae bacterium]
MNEFLLLALLVATLLVLLIVGAILLWRARPSRFIRRFLLVLLAMELLLALAQPGLLAAEAAPLQWHLNLGGEYRLAVAMAAAQLLMAGVAALVFATRLGWRAADGRLPAPAYRLFWFLLGAGFLFLALDEYFVIHETNRPLWRALYLLAGLVMGLPAALLLATSQGRRREYALLLIGIAMMAASAVVLDSLLDAMVRIGSDCAGPDWLATACRAFSAQKPWWDLLEEMAELVGVTLALGALLLLAQKVLPAQAPDAGRLAAWTRASVLVPLTGALAVAAYGAWLWLTPAVQLHFSSERVLVEYLDGDLALLGYRLEGAPASPGERVEVILYWQARRALPEPSLFVSLHALVGPNFDSIAQDDDPQLGTLLPSTAFLPGMIVHKTMNLDLPQDAPTGHHGLMLRVWTGEPPWTHTTGIDVSATDRQLLNPDAVLFAGLDVVDEG